MRAQLWKASAIALALGLPGCLSIKAAPLPPVCQAVPVAVLAWPEEPALHLPANPSPDLAFKAAAATIHNLEAALKAQQDVIKKHNADK